MTEPAWDGPCPPALSPETAPDLRVVSALLATDDGRYLLQLRDDKPGLPLRDHWALFGGAVEAGESPEAALVREVGEELAFVPRAYTRFSDAIYTLPRLRAPVVHKTYFLVPITEAEVEHMVLREGTAKRLFVVEALVRLPRVSPWDLAVILTHARHHTLFAW